MWSAIDDRLLSRFRAAVKGPRRGGRAGGAGRSHHADRGGRAAAGVRPELIERAPDRPAARPTRRRPAARAIPTWVSRLGRGDRTWRTLGLRRRSVSEGELWVRRVRGRCAGAADGRRRRGPWPRATARCMIGTRAPPDPGRDRHRGSSREARRGAASADRGGVAGHPPLVEALVAVASPTPTPTTRTRSPPRSPPFGRRALSTAPWRHSGAWAARPPARARPRPL